jgi:predicted phage tail protein
MGSIGTPGLVDVRLHGHLRERYGESFELAISSPAEAIRALTANLPGFAAAFHESPFYSMLVNGEVIPFEEVTCLRTVTRLDLVPAVSGGKNETTSILIFAAAMFFSAGAASALGGGSWFGSGFATLTGGAANVGFTGFMAYGFLNAGLSALFMGIAMKTQPDSKSANDAEADPNRPSLLFNGAVNTTATGRPVPLCYGELGVGSHVISGGFYTEDSML